VSPEVPVAAAEGGAASLVFRTFRGFPPIVCVELVPDALEGGFNAARAEHTDAWSKTLVECLGAQANWSNAVVVPLPGRTGELPAHSAQDVVELSVTGPGDTTAPADEIAVRLVVDHDFANGDGEAMCRILESNHSVSLLHRRLRGCHLIVDERTCVIVLDASSDVDEAQSEFLRLALDYTMCLCLLVLDQHQVGLDQARILAAFSALAHCAGMAGFRVVIRYVLSPALAARTVRTFCDHTGNTSEIWGSDMYRWASRKWLQGEESQHERLLAMMPGMDPFRAQACLTLADLRSIVRMCENEWAAKFPWFVQRARERFIAATTVMREVDFGQSQPARGHLPNHGDEFPGARGHLFYAGDESPSTRYTAVHGGKQRDSAGHLPYGRALADVSLLDVSQPVWDERQAALNPPSSAGPSQGYYLAADTLPRTGRYREANGQKNGYPPRHKREGARYPELEHLRAGQASRPMLPHEAPHESWPSSWDTAGRYRRGSSEWENSLEPDRDWFGSEAVENPARRRPGRSFDHSKMGWPGRGETRWNGPGESALPCGKTAWLGESKSGKMATTPAGGTRCWDFDFDERATPLQDPLQRSSHHANLGSETYRRKHARIEKSFDSILDSARRPPPKVGSDSTADGRWTHTGGVEKTTKGKEDHPWWQTRMDFAAVGCRARGQQSIGAYGT